MRGLDRLEQAARRAASKARAAARDPRRLAGRAASVAGDRLTEYGERLSPAGSSAAPPWALSSFVERLDNRTRSIHAGYWHRRLTEVFPGRRPALLVVVHADSQDGLDVALAGLRELETPHDLIVTDASEDGIDTSGLPTSSLALSIMDQGRDQLPLVVLALAGAFDSHDVVLKINASSRTHPEPLSPRDLAGIGEVSPMLRDLFTPGGDVAAIVPREVLFDPFDADADLPIVQETLLRIPLVAPGASVRRVEGRVQWARSFLFQGLRALGVSEWDFDIEADQTQGTMAHALPSVIGVLAAEAGLRVLTPEEAEAASEAPSGAVASRAQVFPLVVGEPEWNSVVRAGPVYAGHRQPFLPADLEDAIASPVDGRDHAHRTGIAGFLYRTTDGRPLGRRWAPSDAAWEHLRSTSSAGLGLFWDNESHRVELAREHGELDDEPAAGLTDALEAFEGFLPFLSDERCMRYRGRPALVVGTVHRLASFPQVARALRERAAEAGIVDLALLAVSDGRPSEVVPDRRLPDGIDAVVRIPNGKRITGPSTEGVVRPHTKFEGHLRYYPQFADQEIAAVEALRLPDVVPAATAGFDDSSQSRWHPQIVVGANPYTFRRWLARLVSRNAPACLVVVDSWNDWTRASAIAESGAYGTAFLGAVRDVVGRRTNEDTDTPSAAK